MQDDSKWYPVGPDAVVWREWDREVVLYNDATGDTHHLDQLGAGVMLSLLRHPRGVDTHTLLQETRARLGGDMPEPAVDLEPVLAGLVMLKLAARCPA